MFFGDPPWLSWYPPLYNTSGFLYSMSSLHASTHVAVTKEGCPPDSDQGPVFVCPHTLSLSLSLVRTACGACISPHAPRPIPRRVNELVSRQPDR